MFPKIKFLMYTYVLLSIILICYNQAIIWMILTVVMTVVISLVVRDFNTPAKESSNTDSYYSKSGRNGTERTAHSENGHPETDEAFVYKLCTLCGYVACADGHIDPEELDIVDRLIENSNSEQRDKMQLAFNTGCSPFFSADDIAESCAFMRRDPYSQSFVLNILWSIVTVDNILTENELKRLQDICHSLCIPEVELKRKIYQFNTQTQQSRSSRGSSDNDTGSANSSSSGNSDSRRTASQKQSGGQLYALRILGLEAGASEDEIRHAYLRLIKEYHPDRLKARGITGYLRSEYEEKCKQITAAYNYLKSS